MHSISIINNEFLFHLILTVRKIIPNSEYFYILLFLFKFIPLILFTHALYSVHSSLFTLNKVFRSVTIFYHSNRNLNYKALCIFIYLFLIVLILLIGFIVIYLRYKSKKSYAFEKGTNRIKMIIKITTYLIIIVMFLYQHIMEVLLYGIIEVIFSYVDKSEFKEGYEMHISGNEKYIFFGFNIIFFICMILIMLGALFITSNKIIKSQYGYKSSQSLYVSLTYCLLWSFQGAYSASYNLKEELQEKYHVTDRFILDAIRYHTTGRPGMTELEKIIYIADYIEPNRKMLFNLQGIRAAAFRDLNEAMVLILQNTLQYLEDKNVSIDQLTQETYDYYRNITNRKENL